MASKSTKTLSNESTAAAVTKLTKDQVHEDAHSNDASAIVALAYGDSKGVCEAFVTNANAYSADNQNLINDSGSLAMLARAVFALPDYKDKKPMEIFTALQSGGFIGADDVGQWGGFKFTRDFLSVVGETAEQFGRGANVPDSWLASKPLLEDAKRLAQAKRLGAIAEFKQKHPVLQALQRYNPSKVKQVRAVKVTTANTEKPKADPMVEAKETKTLAAPVCTLNDWVNVAASYMASKPTESQRNAVLKKITDMLFPADADM